jgi:DNA polymerase III gamma/tau subunit
MNAVMSIVQSLADHGRDLERLYSDIIACLRNLMLCAVCPEPEKLLEVGQSELRDLRNIAGAVEADTIQRLLQGLVTQEWSFRSALNKRVYLEAALARVMVDAHSVQLDDILAQLTAMAATGDIPRLAAPAPKTAPVIPPPPASEQAAPTVVGGKPRPAGRTQTAPPETGKKGTPAKTPAKTDAKPPVTSTEIPAPQEQPEEVAQHQVPREKTAPEPAADTTETPSDVADAPDTPAEKAAPAESTEPPQSTPPAEEPRPEPEPHAPRETEGEEQSRQTAAQDRETDADTQHADETPQEETSQSDKKAPAETTDETPAETTDAEDEDLTLETQTEAPAGDTGPKAPQTPTTPPPKAGGPEAVAAWERLLAELDEREEWRPLEPLVKQLAPVSVIDGLLQLGYPDDMPEQTVKLLREPKSQTILNLAFRAALDDDQVGITIKRWHAKLSADERAGTKQAPPEVREQVEQKEFVKKVQMLFDASIIDVRV